MDGFVTWLDGKKTILAGLIVAILSGLRALGVSLPFSGPTEDAIIGILGVVVIVARMFAQKPGALAKSDSKS